MAVHQTRAHFHGKYGDIVDNAEIGPELLRNYWLQGSGEPGFLKMVEDLTAGESLLFLPFTFSTTATYVRAAAAFFSKLDNTCFKGASSPPNVCTACIYPTCVSIRARV